jgi:hypothetical protein
MGFVPQFSILLRQIAKDAGLSIEGLLRNC